MYSPESNRWTQVVTDNCPDGIAGHGATIVDDSMVVFGGYHGHGTRSVHSVYCTEVCSMHTHSTRRRTVTHACVQVFFVELGPDLQINLRKNLKFSLNFPKFILSLS